MVTSQRTRITPEPGEEEAPRRRWVKPLAALGTVAGLLIAYLSLAHQTSWPPFSGADGLMVTSPQDGYQIRGDFTIEVSGNPGDSKEVWVVARDESGDWYPLDKASHEVRKGTWISKIRYEQMGPPTPDLELHVVSANSDASHEFTSSMRGENFNEGLERLPDGSESLDSISTSVVKR
jgi:hypothetical protein